MKRALVFIVFIFSLPTVFSQYDSTDWHSVELSSEELVKVEAIKALIHSDSILLFKEKHDIWVESTNDPSIQMHSNPNAYKTAEYYDFAAFTRRQGPAYIGLLIDFFIDNHVGVDYYLLLDIVNIDYLPLLDGAKAKFHDLQYPPGGEKVFYTRVSLAYLYFKAILSKITIVENEVMVDFMGWCDIDPWIKENYSIDAMILALREIYADEEHPYRDNVFVPKEPVWKYLGALSSIYRDESANRDSIFYLYPIHAYSEISYSEITMKVDTNSAWVYSFLEDSIHTGNQVFDAIISPYYFKLQNFTETNNGAYIQIASPFMLNLLPLLEKIRTIEGVLLTDHNFISPFDMGYDIQARQGSDTIFLDFSIGWGDCPAGCIARHQWNYSITDCSAVFEDWTGDRIEGSPYGTPRAYDPLVDTTKQWNILETVYEEGDVYIEYLYKRTIAQRFRGDTLIDSKKYKFLETCLNDSTFSDWTKSDYLFREDLKERKVYAYTSGSEMLLYDFSLGIGDTLMIHGPYIVDTIDNQTFFAEKRRLKIFFGNWGDYEMLEGIGTLGDLRDPYFWGITCNTRYSELLCFYQRGQLLYQKEDHCYFYKDYTNVYEAAKEALIKIYPNPASDNLAVEVNEPNHDFSLSFRGMDGKVFKSCRLKGQNEVVSVRDLNSGIYLLFIAEDGIPVFRELVIISR